MSARIDRADGEQPGLTPPEHRRLADVLLAAASRRRPVEPLSRRYAEFTLGDARTIRDVLLVRRLAAGEQLAGAKPANGASALDATGLGWITSGMVLDAGPVALAALVHPRVEPKLGLRLGAALAGPRVDAGQMLAATALVHPVLEVVDSRYGSDDLTLADEVADNCAAACLRIGPGSVPAGTEQLERVAFHLDVAGPDRAADAAPARRTLAPLAPLVALAQQLVDAGRAPQAGMVLLSPRAAAPLALRGETRVRLNCDELGEVELHTTGMVDQKEEEDEH